MDSGRRSAWRPVPWALGFVLAAVTLYVAWWARRNYSICGWMPPLENQVVCNVVMWGSLGVLFLIPILVALAAQPPGAVGPAWPVVEFLVVAGGVGFAWFQMFVAEVGSEAHMPLAHASGAMSWASSVDKCVRAVRVREWGRAFACVGVGLASLPFACLIVVAVVAFE